MHIVKLMTSMKQAEVHNRTDIHNYAYGFIEVVDASTKVQVLVFNNQHIHLD
jgi:hypothetical protein